MEAVRVGIVGAGVSGCACAWSLVQAAKRPVHITLYEMGRGAGGRAATRKSRDAPGLGVNHGAPLFHISNATDGSTKNLIGALSADGHIAEWTGTSGQVDMVSGASTSGPASHGEPKDDFKRYIGTSGMASLSEGILKLTNKEMVLTKYGTKVAEFNPQSSRTGWELLDKDGKSAGEFDWLVITSASLAHPRFSLTSGETPPLHITAQKANSPQLSAVIEKISSTVTFKGVHCVMAAWEIKEGVSGSVVEALQKLPYDITAVTGDQVLAKVVRQSLGPQWAVVLLHSTSEFTEKNLQTIGSKSAAAQHLSEAVVSSGVASEKEIQDEIWSAFTRFLGGTDLEKPTFGPHLHRWSAAFSEGQAPTDAAAAWLVPEAQMVMAGDFIAPPYGCVESALKSGIAAGEAIVKAIDPDTSSAL